MGIIDSSSPLFGASGRVGKIIVYSINDKTYFRSFPKEVRNPRSFKQQLQRNRITGVQTLYKSLKRTELREAFDREAIRKGVRSGYHLFMSLNMQAIGQNEYVDHGLLTLCTGHLQLPFELQISRITKATVATDAIHTAPSFHASGQEPHHSVEVTWADNSDHGTARADDMLNAAFISAKAPYNIIQLSPSGNRRADRTGRILLPADAGNDIHLYVFFRSASGNLFSASNHFHLSF